MTAFIRISVLLLTAFINYLPFTVWLGYDEDTANLQEIGQDIVDLIHNFDSISNAIESILGDPHGAAAAAGIDVDLAEHWQATAGVCGCSQGQRY